MKPEDNKPVDDQQLDADLNSIEQVYRRAQAQEPPDMLDQAVLNKARHAAEVKKSGWHFGGFRWVSAFATASVVVVALALIMEQTAREPLPRDMPAKPASRTETYEIDLLSADDNIELMESSEEREADSLQAEGFRAKRAQSPDQKIDLSAAKQTLGRSRNEEVSAPVAAAPMPIEQQPRNDEAQLKNGFTDRRAIIANNKANLEKTGSDADTQEAASGTFEMAVEPQLERELDTITVSGSAVMADPLPPEVWIRRIMQLKNAQQNAEFEKELAKFRKIYPDYELPDEFGIE